MKVVVLASVAALLSVPASAARVEFGASYRTPAALWARVGVSDVALWNGQAAFGVSTHAADLGYARGVALPPLGAVTASGSVAVPWTGGLRAETRVIGSLGPVALNVAGRAFTARAEAVDPLAPYAAAPTDLRERGWGLDLTARYRLSRTLIVVAGTELGAQPHALLGLEGRRDLTRTLPLPEDAQEGDEPETEALGTVTWRLGARAGQEVLGVSGGVTYATEGGVSVALDGLVGPNTLGLTGALSAPDVLGEGRSLRLYAAYEPWRRESAPLRAGLEASVPLGRGELGVGLVGGQRRGGAPGFGVRVGYAVTLGGAAGGEQEAGEEAEPTPEPAGGETP